MQEEQHYLVQSKTRGLIMRDGYKKDSPRFKLPLGRAVPFRHMPAYTAIPGDADVSVTPISKAEFDKRVKDRKTLEEERASRYKKNGYTTAEKETIKKLRKVAADPKHPQKARAAERLKEEFHTTVEAPKSAKA